MPAPLPRIGVCVICCTRSRLVPHPTIPDEHWCQDCTDEPFVNDDELPPLPPMLDYAIHVLAQAHKAARPGTGR